MSAATVVVKRACPPKRRSTISKKATRSPRGFEISYRRQQYRRHECHAPDPDNNGEDMERSSDRYVIHRARLYSPDHREV